MAAHRDGVASCTELCRRRYKFIHSFSALRCWRTAEQPQRQLTCESSIDGTFDSHQLSHADRWYSRHTRQCDCGDDTAAGAVSGGASLKDSPEGRNSSGGGTAHLQLQYALPFSKWRSASEQITSWPLHWKAPLHCVWFRTRVSHIALSLAQPMLLPSKQCSAAPSDLRPHSALLVGGCELSAGVGAAESIASLPRSRNSMRAASGGEADDIESRTTVPRAFADDVADDACSF